MPCPFAALAGAVEEAGLDQWITVVAELAVEESVVAQVHAGLLDSPLAAAFAPELLLPIRSVRRRANEGKDSADRYASIHLLAFRWNIR